MPATTHFVTERSLHRTGGTAQSGRFPARRSARHTRSCSSPSSSCRVASSSPLPATQRGPLMTLDALLPSRSGEEVEGWSKAGVRPPPRPPPKPWCPEALRPSTAGWTNGFGGLEMQPSLVSGREGCQKDSSFSLGWPGSGEPVLSLSRATLRGSSRCC